MKLRILHRGPQTFWIGPELSFIYGQTFVTMSACWGWDKDDPVSLSPNVRVDSIGDGRVYVASWAGFNLNVATLPLSAPFRMEAALGLLSKVRLIEWNV